MAIAERVALARRALAAAETATGLRAAAPPATSRPVTDRTDDRFLDVPEALAPLFPHGAMRRGSTTVVSGSTSLELHLVATLMSGGAWCAVAGRDDLGLAAAAEAGVALERVAVVPRPGPDAPAVLGALVDGFDIISIGPCRALTDSDRRLLSARVRGRGGILLSSAPWPGAELVLTASVRTWHGVADGRGMLQAGHLDVVATGRGIGQRRPIEIEVRSDGATTSLSRHPRTGRSTADVPGAVAGDGGIGEWLERAG